jgi:hypothetical protein
MFAKSLSQSFVRSGGRPYKPLGIGGRNAGDVNKQVPVHRSSRRWLDKSSKRDIFVRMCISLSINPVVKWSFISRGSAKLYKDGNAVYYHWFFHDLRGLLCHRMINIEKLFRMSGNIGAVRSALASKVACTQSYAVRSRIVPRVRSRTFARKQLATDQILARITRSVTYWLDRYYDDWCADPGYKLFFPEIYLKDDPTVRLKFDDLDLWGSLFRFDTFAELSGDHAAVSQTNMFIRFRSSDVIGDRRRFQKREVKIAWDWLITYCVRYHPKFFPGLRLGLRGRDIDPLNNPDVSCLFSNLKWPLSVITGDYLLDSPKYDNVAIKPCNRLCAQ